MTPVPDIDLDDPFNAIPGRTDEHQFRVKVIMVK
jgi:hypothetical protein